MGDDDDEPSAAVPLPPEPPATGVAPPAYGQYPPPAAPQWNQPVPAPAVGGYGMQPTWAQCQGCGGPTGSGLGCPACGQLVGGAPGHRIASPGKRLGEYLLEFLLVIVTLGIGWFIWSLVVWSNGQTPAKQLLHMRVYTIADRRPAGWGRMALREFVVRGIVVGGLSAITFGVGFIVSALLVLNTNRQTLWDLIAQTVVVDEP
jgi:RDD family